MGRCVTFLLTKQLEDFRQFPSVACAFLLVWVFVEVVRMFGVWHEYKYIDAKFWGCEPSKLHSTSTVSGNKINNKTFEHDLNKYRMSLYIPNNSHRNHQSTRKSRFFFFAGNTTKTLTKTSSNAGCSGIYALDLRTSCSMSLLTPFPIITSLVNLDFFGSNPQKNGKSTVHPPFFPRRKKIYN